MLSHTLLVIAAVFVAPATAFSAPATAAPGLSRPPAEFLRAVLAARTPDAEREGLLDELALLRRGRSRDDGAGEAAWRAATAALLAEVDARASSPLARAARAAPWLRLPSFRANAGCAATIVALTAGDDDADELVRAQALAVALGQLRAERKPTARKGRKYGIAHVLSEAKRRTRREASIEEMLSRTPEGLETPQYATLASRAGWEVRSYDGFAVCSTREPGPKAFGTLAGYIFGQNEPQTKMAMTTPVIMDRAAGTMSFVMPSDYWGGGERGEGDALEGAPAPRDGDDVTLGGDGAGVGGARVAALWYGGLATLRDVSARQAQLLAALERDGEWRVEPGATPLVANYNDPFTSPWKRRNEVLVRVVRREETTAE